MHDGARRIPGKSAPRELPPKTLPPSNLLPPTPENCPPSAGKLTYIYSHLFENKAVN